VNIFILLQALREPDLVEYPSCGAVCSLDELDFVGVFQADFAAVLLAEEGSDYWLGLPAEGVAGDKIGDCEEDEGVQEGAEAGVGALCCGDERGGGGHRGLNGG